MAHQNQQIDKYIFPSSTVSRMKRSINGTKSDKRERAFTLCLDKATMKVYPGEEHVEESQTESGYIKFNSECRERNHKVTGTFHSHITTTSKEASALDLYSNCSEQNDISCIGSHIDGKVTCTVKKNQGTNCQHEVKLLLDEENKLIESGQNSKDNKLYEKVDGIIRENFKTGELKI